MTGHTPGPWRWDKGVDDDPTRCFVTQGIQGQPEYVIAEIQNGAPGDCLETEEANARLIAAAPDLLAACKEFVRKCECGEAKSVRSYAQMAAAIAKAEGRDEN